MAGVFLSKKAFAAVELNCPACGVLVQLPANEGPKCRANLRAGERPEPHVPFWKRKKTMLILAVVPLTPLACARASSRLEGGVGGWDRLGLEGGAKPREMREEFELGKFERSVKSGFNSWHQNRNKRHLGRQPRLATTAEQALPQEQKSVNQDNRNCFASTLTSAAASHKLQDALTVPYRWSPTPAGLTPISSTTLRTCNEKLGLREGIPLAGGRMTPFRVVKPPQNQDALTEHCQAEDGALTIWLFGEVMANSFKVAVGESSDGGTACRHVADAWAKQRLPVLP
jgi:hypothetical protein